jgi:hypothetical protein
MNSPRFELNKEQLMKGLRVFGWATASSLVAFVGTSLVSVQVDSQYAVLWSLLVGVVNSFLVIIKEYITNEQGKI